MSAAMDEKERQLARRLTREFIESPAGKSALEKGPNYVYSFRAPRKETRGAIKIGVTTVPGERLVQHQKSYGIVKGWFPVSVCCGGVEETVHYLLKNMGMNSVPTRCLLLDCETCTRGVGHQEWFEPKRHTGALKPDSWFTALIIVVDDIFKLYLGSDRRRRVEGLCEEPTKKGTPCKNKAANCRFHFPRERATPVPPETDEKEPVTPQRRTAGPAATPLRHTPGLCGATTRKGTPCKIRADECNYHRRRESEEEKGPATPQRRTAGPPVTPQRSTAGTCGATTKKGTPCKIKEGRCPHHSPSKSAPKATTEEQEQAPKGEDKAPMTPTETRARSPPRSRRSKTPS